MNGRRKRNKWNKKEYTHSNLRKFVWKIIQKRQKKWIERAIAETEAAKETKRMRLHAETAETELEAKEEKKQKS